MPETQLNLWRVTGDWSDWQALTGESLTRDEYEAIAKAAAQQAHDLCHAVYHVEMSAAQMRAELDARGWANTRENRAKIIAGAAR